MEIKRLHVGKRLSEVTIHNGTVYLAGQVPELAEQGGVHRPGRPDRPDRPQCHLADRGRVLPGLRHGRLQPNRGGVGAR